MEIQAPDSFNTRSIVSASGSETLVYGEAVVLLASQDEKLQQRITGYLGQRLPVVVCATHDQAGRALSAARQSLLLVELTLPWAMEIISEAKQHGGQTIIIALGDARSEPGLEADQMGVHGILDKDPDRKTLQRFALLACELASPVRTSSSIADETARANQRPGEIHLLDRAVELLKSVGHPEAVFSRIVEAISRELTPVRVSIFVRDPLQEGFHFRAGIRENVVTHSAVISLDDPLVALLARYPSALYRGMRDRLSSSENARLELFFLKHAGNVLIPLHAEGDLLGWLLLELAPAALESDGAEFVVIGEKVSPVLAQVLAQEEIGLNQIILRNVCSKVPCGVVVLDDQNRVLWLNHAAELFVGGKYEDIIRRPLAEVSPILEKSLSPLLRQDAGMKPEVILTLADGKVLKATVFREKTQAAGGTCVLIDEVTAEARLREEHELLQRSLSLAELSRDVAFRVRGPLTAIKTFSQLLPENFSDEEFCKKFGDIVGTEVERLSNLTESLEIVTALGSSAVLSKKSCLVPDCVSALQSLLTHKARPLSVESIPGLPALEMPVEKATECLFHLLANAMDAAENRPDGRVVLQIGLLPVDGGKKMIQFLIIDNRLIKKIGGFVDNSHLGSESAIRKAELRIAWAAGIAREYGGLIEATTGPSGVQIQLCLPAIL